MGRNSSQPNEAESGQQYKPGLEVSSNKLLEKKDFKVSFCNLSHYSIYEGFDASEQSLM